MKLWLTLIADLSKSQLELAKQGSALFSTSTTVADIQKFQKAVSDASVSGAERTLEAYHDTVRKTVEFHAKSGIVPKSLLGSALLEQTMEAQASGFKQAVKAVNTLQNELQNSYKSKS